MKKKWIANIIMIAIIAAIFVAGVLGVGHIQGWFDQTDGTQAVLGDMRGVVRLERDGVSYTVEAETVLRAGDKITCDPGATAVVKLGGSALTLGEKAEVTVTEPSVDGFAAEVAAGEVFASCEGAATVSFAGKEVTLSQATALFSIRTGAQSISVLRGTVADASAGQVLNYIAGEPSVGTLDINALSDFAVTQIRLAGSREVLCFTEEDLDQLEADRQAAVQEMIDSQTQQTQPTEPDATQETTVAASQPEGTTVPTKPTQADSKEPTEPEASSAAPTPTQTTPTETEPVETKPQQTEPPAAAGPAVAGSCTITIRCDTILENMDALKPEKAGFVPSNGVILSTVRVSFYEGETVLDVLKRVCDTAGIPLEYVWSPIFGTYYVEGINNLYEKDCGSESGWMYKVNGWFPNYGVSNYTLSDGDVIAFLYSCKGYGTDVGAPEWEG